MSKKIDWLDNFAEKYAKDIKMTKSASKVTREDIIVNREEVGTSKVGEVINFNGKLYKIADLDFTDDKGPGAVLNEVEDNAGEGAGVEQTPGGEVSLNDPMSMKMGTPAAPFETGQKSQEYARTNPGDVYHYEVAETFEQAAAETAQQIEKERNFDRSTVPGHYTAPKDMGGATVAPIITPEVVAPVITPEVVPEEVTEEEVPEVDADLTIESTEEPKEKEEELEEEVTAVRHNRILRRIMSSK